MPIEPPDGKEPTMPASEENEKFAFGLWCLMNRGGDPFGEPVREAMSQVAAMEGLARRGYWGYEFHDNDLWPINAGPREIGKVVATLAKAMDRTGLRCASGTTNLFTHPVFKDGAFTSHDPKVRALAIAKAMRTIDAAAELGAENFIFWGGREGAEVDIAKSPVDGIRRYRDAICFLVQYILDNKYSMTVTVEPKPNEPRGDIYLPTVGSVLAFIATMPAKIGRRVGVNPEFAHVKMAGLNVVHEYGQALEAGKLFELHLNGQNPLRYDQDLSFGSDNPKEGLLLVHMLESNGFDGIIAFDAHPYRVEDNDGVWDFVERNIRNYRLFRDKARQIDADPRIAELLDQIGAASPSLVGRYSAAEAARIKAMKFDPDALATRRLPYERLDQVLTEILLGVNFK
ncbi:MAG: Xylose isomerase [Phycisphaerae bacterium]|nr:Xylose isomerase [Phycisphaerae bacterium]